MTEAASHASAASPPDQAAIGEVSRLLDVPIATLHSWQSNFGVPSPSREPDGAAFYSPEEIQLLRLMRDEIASGRHPASAASAVLHRPEPKDPTRGFIVRVLDASESSDPASIRGVLDEADQSLGLADCIDDVVMPTMRQIGLWWAIGYFDIPRERMTTEAVRAWLDYRNAFAPPPRSGGPILLACGPRDRHTIGLEALATLLRSQGWPCRLLGSRTQTSHLLTAATATDAAAVVLVSHVATGHAHAVASIETIHRSGIEVFYAGNAFSGSNSRENLPGRYLGTRLGDACSMIVAALTPPE